MINEYQYLEEMGVIGVELPPVAQTDSPLVDEILSKHEWYDTEYFRQNQGKRKRLRYFTLDERFFVDTRPPVYTRKGCIQIPLNYNLNLYHDKCKIDQNRKFSFNENLKITKLKSNLAILNTLEHATSHGHFITQIIPQLWHCRKYFPDRNILIPLNREEWMEELLGYFNVRQKNLFFQSLPRDIHVQANNTLHLEIPDHSSGVMACRKFIEKNKIKSTTIDDANKILLTRDFHYSRRELEAEGLSAKDFKIINPLKLKMIDAERVLSNASVVITEFGGAMTNLIHCSRETKIVILIPEALLDHRLNAKPKMFVYNVLEWLHPFLFDYNLRIVKGAYQPQNGELYRWSSGDQLGSDERTKCTYSLTDILNG